MLAQLKADLASLDPRKRSQDFKRGARNASYSVAGHLLLPVLWLISTPIFVSHLGIDRYGIWMLTSALLGMSGLMAFGLTDATIKFVSQYRATSDDAAIERVVRCSFAVYGFLGLFAAAATILAAPLLVRHIFHVESHNAELAVHAFQIGGIALTVRFVDSVFLSVLHGYERYDWAARITMVMDVLTFGVNLLLLLGGYGLLSVLAATTILLVPGAVWKASVVRRKLLPSLALSPSFDRDVFRTMFRFGFWGWLQSVGGILLSQVDRLLIASFLGTSALTYYVVCLQLAQQIHVVISRAVSFTFPLASAVKESGDLDRLRRIYFKGSSFTIVAAVGLGLPLFIFANNILTLWMGPEFAEASSGILRLLVLFYTALATTIVPFYFLNGTGLVRLNTMFGLASGSAVVAATIFLMPLLGLAGAAWARTLNIAIDLVSRAVLHYQVLFDRRWFAGFLVLLPVIIPFAIGFAASEFFGSSSLSIVPLVLEGVAYSLSGMAVATLVCRRTMAPPALKVTT